MVAIVSVPTRCGVLGGLVSAENNTFDVPADPAETIVSQLGSLLAAVQVHADGAITPTVPRPPDVGTDPVADCKA